MKRLGGGLYPVMLTPFTNIGKIDYQSLEELVEFYIFSGAKGLFTNCLSSEMYCLTEDERFKLTRHVVKFVNGRIPVVSTGTFSFDIQDCIVFSEKIYDTGVNAVIINSNQFLHQLASEEEFKSRLESFMIGTNNIPLGIYECPVPYKRLISPELLKWIADSNRFLYLKDTSSENQLIDAKLTAIKGTNLRLFNANAPTGLHSLYNGASGLSPIGANFFPELYAYVCDNFNDENFNEEVVKINTFITMVDQLIHTSYPYSAKWFLKERGLKITTYVRTEYNPFVSQDYMKFQELLEAFKDIRRLTSR